MHSYVYNVLPVFGTMIGTVWLGETFGWSQLVGGGLIILGSIAAVWSDFGSASRVRACERARLHRTPDSLKKEPF